MQADIMAGTENFIYIVSVRYICSCLADLDHTNADLRKSLVDWMNWLKSDIGFASWRFDFVKGYGAEFMQQYCGETVGNDALNVGEFWCDLRYARL